MFELSLARLSWLARTMFIIMPIVFAIANGTLGFHL